MLAQYAQRRVFPGLIPDNPPVTTRLRHWSRTDRGVTLNGSAVSALVDFAGVTAGVAQATGANQPAYGTAGFGGRLPSYRGDSTDFLASTSVSFTTASLSAYVVAARHQTVISQAGILTLIGSGTNDYDTADGFILYEPNSQANVSLYRNSTPLGVITHPGDGVPMVLSCRFDGAYGYFRCNGTRAERTASTGAFATTKIFIGCRYFTGGPTYGSRTDHGDVLVYDRFLDDREDDAMVGWLRQKWAIDR